jgi:hypothetical protein
MPSNELVINKVFFFLCIFVYAVAQAAAESFFKSAVGTSTTLKASFNWLKESEVNEKGGNINRQHLVLSPAFGAV